MDRLLITGTGYSGTTYMHTLFQHLGCDSAHEEFSIAIPKFAHDIVISWEALTVIKTLPDDVKVAHQFRHPLKVIRRILGSFDDNLRTPNISHYNTCRLGESIGALPKDKSSRIKLACELYVRWHKAITKYQKSLSPKLFLGLPSDKTMTYKIEDIDTEIYRLRNFINANWSDESIQEALSSIPKNTYTKVGWFNLYDDVNIEHLTTEVQNYICELEY